MLFLEEFLERRGAVVVEDRGDLAVAAMLLFLDDDEVTVGDVGVDHRVAGDLEDELVLGVLPILEAELFSIFDGLERAPEALIGLFEGNNRGKRAVRV